jgi:hypothetical protein
MLLNRETWRHSYGRKLYRARLEKFELRLPVDPSGEIDDQGIGTWLEANPLWKDVGSRVLAGVERVNPSVLALMCDSGG